MSEQSNVDWNEIERIVDDLNDRHAVIKIQGKTVIMNKEIESLFGREEITFSSEANFNLWYKNTRVLVGQTKSGDKYNSHSEVWIKHDERRQFKGFCFETCQDYDTNYFNLWRGFSVEPKKGDCSLYYDHLFDNVASGDQEIYDYVLDWMADVVQNPTNLPGVAFVLRGGQGAGKGTAISLFMDIFGQHSLQVSHSKHVVGHFNAHLKDCVILFADEAFWAGDKEHESTLKTLITEDKRMIEYKGKDALPFPNYVHLMMSSNKDWVAPMDMDDRRFFIIDIKAEKAKKEDYFNPIYKQMRGKNYKSKKPGAGTSALLYDLQNRKITRSIRDIPETKAKLDNKIESMDSIDRWIYDSIHPDSNYKLSAINIAELYKDYLNRCEKFKLRPVSKNGWSRGIRKVFPGLKARQQSDGVRFYEFPEMDDCRAAFCVRINFEIDWYGE